MSTYVRSPHAEDLHRWFIAVPACPAHAQGCPGGHWSCGEWVWHSGVHYELRFDSTTRDLGGQQ